MNSLNRETTIANRLPAALRVLFTAGTVASGTFSILICVSRFLAGIDLSLIADLLPLELRLPLLQKRARAFLLIFRRAAYRKERRFQI